MVLCSTCKQSTYMLLLLFFSELRISKLIFDEKINISFLFYYITYPNYAIPMLDSKNLKLFFLQFVFRVLEKYGQALITFERITAEKQLSYAYWSN